MIYALVPFLCLCMIGAMVRIVLIAKDRQCTPPGQLVGIAAKVVMFVWALALLITALRHG